LVKDRVNVVPHILEPTPTNSISISTETCPNYESTEKSVNKMTQLQNCLIEFHTQSIKKWATDIQKERKETVTETE